MEKQPTSSLGGSGRGGWWVLVLLGLVGLGGVGFLVWTRLQQAPPVPPVVASVVDAGEAPTEPEVNLADADAALAADAGLPPLIGAWLAEPGAVHLLAAAVWQVSEGESPRASLQFLGPADAFSVEIVDGRTFMSKQSAARYDFVAQALGSVDATQAGRIYGRVDRFVEAAFKGISPPGRTFLGAVDQAIARLSAVPLRDDPLEVVPLDAGTGYRFADPELERLDPAQKHLLRLGPANARVVVSQLTAFRRAVGR